MTGSKDINRKTPFISSTAVLPLLVTVSILLCWLLFRIGIFLWAITTRCMPIHEFWFSSYSNAWPLVGAFALVFLLLFVWNASLFLGPELKSKADRIILSLNAAALTLVGYAMFNMSQTAELSYFHESDFYGSWNATEPWFGPHACDAAKPFLGHWEVVQAEMAKDADPFPTSWIEFRRDLTFRASDGRWDPIIEGDWYPPGRSNDGWIYGPDFDALWEFKVEDDRLYLQTPDWKDLPMSMIELKRAKSKPSNQNGLR